MILLISVYITDLVFGDPEGFPHPVRWIGKLISKLDNALRGGGSRLIERAKGAALALIVIAVSGTLAYLLIEFARTLNPIAGAAVWIYLGYVSLSIKDLQVKARSVLKALKSNSVTSAQRELSKIVGRETNRLNADQILTATMESVAENTNDGISAPLFYLILGGPVLAIIYKSINTLDSMIGYKNEKYKDFGWFSARLDDIANFIPARITGFLIAISSVIARHEVPKQSQDGIAEPVPSVARDLFGLLAMTPLKKFKNSLLTMFKDGRKHSSPNAGVCEAAMAGALGVRLGGPSVYFGRVVEKPYIGEFTKTITVSSVTDSLKISFVTSFLMLFTGVCVKWLV